MKFTPIWILFVLFFSSCSSTNWLKGSWSGTGDQIDEKSWSVELKVDNKDAFQIDYPSLSCGGKWELVEKNNLQITFKENITYGVELCDQGVEAIVTKLGADEIQIVYYLRKYFADQAVATAKLKRIN